MTVTHARAAASTIEFPNGTLPLHVQWMPPGRQTVQPMGFDSPFEMTVTPAIALLANNQLQQLRTAAAAGKDVEPYFDFNHKDEGRAFKPTRFFWAGNDPKTGGIRAEGTWTGAGAKAVLDGELCCVSASWLLHKQTKEFLGIKHNVGGLVPRSAFHSIQAFAKAGTSAPLDLSNSNSKELADTLSALAKAHQSRTGSNFKDAWRAAKTEVFATAPDQRNANAIYNRAMELCHHEGLGFTTAHARAKVEHHAKAAAALAPHR